MWEQWGIESLYALGRMFLNPLTYWAFLLVIIAGARRVKRERKHFGVKIHDLFSEVKGTFFFSLSFAIIISIVSITAGFVLSIEILIVLAAVAILFSLNGSFQSLSAAYTIGTTFVLFMLLPILPDAMFVPYFSNERLMDAQFLTLAILLSILLFAEGLLTLSANKAPTFPKLALSERGVWIGEQELKRLSFIPFLAFIPAGNDAGLAPFFPVFQFADESFYLTFVPMIIGVQYTARTQLMPELRRDIAKQKFILAFIVLALTIASYYYFIFALLSIIIAIIGNEWITYRNRIKHLHGKAVLAPCDEGVKVIGTIPGTKAEELEIFPGEIIAKVNDMKVTNSNEFYEALQQSGAFFKLDVIDLNQEVRFLKSAFYDEDHHGLGLLFPEAPFQEKQKARVEKLKAL